MNIAAALLVARPGAQWTIHHEPQEGVEYVEGIPGLVWHDTEQAPPTAAELEAAMQTEWYGRGLDRMRDYRTPLLDALSGIAGRLARANQPEDAAAADAAAQALLDLPQWLDALPGSVTLNGITVPVPAPTDDESFDDACLARYREIAAGCPSSVQSAFREAV